MSEREMASDAEIITDPQLLAIEIAHQCGIGFGGTPGPIHMSIEALIESAFAKREALAERERDEARRELEKTRSALIAMIRVVEKCQTIFNEKIIRSTISVGVSTGWIWDEEMHVARQLIANYESPKPAKELEWRGLLIMAATRGWTWDMIGGGGNWILYYGDGGVGREFPLAFDGTDIPSRPDDATVAKIRSVING